MPSSDPYKLITRIVSEATDTQLDDASFRIRAHRVAKPLQRALEAPAAPAKRGRPATLSKQRPAGRSQTSAY